MDNANPAKKMDEVINKTADSLLIPLEINNKIIEAMAKPVEPVVKQTGNMKKLMDNFNRAVREKMNKVLFSTHHDNIIDAMIADFVDVLPGLGDITSAERLADARRKGDRDAITAHGMDTFVDNIFDFIPVFGELAGSVLDALLPTNTLLYLKKKGIIEWEPPLPPLPKIKR